MSKNYTLFSKVSIEVQPPMKVKKLDINRDKDDNVVQVSPSWSPEKGKPRKSVPFLKDKETEVTPEQFGWKTIQQLIEKKLVIVQSEPTEKSSKKEKEPKKDPIKVETDDAEKDTLMAKCEELGIKVRSNATVDGMRKKIKAHNEKVAVAKDQTLPIVE